MPPVSELAYLYYWCCEKEREAIKIKDGCKCTDVISSYMNIKDELIWLGYWLYNVYVPDLVVKNDNY